MRSYHAETVASIVRAIELLGATVESDPATQLLTINSEFSVSICIARHLFTNAGSSRWKVRFDSKLRPDVTIGVRMDQENEAALDYYLLPRLDFQSSSVRLALHNELALDVYRFESIEPLLRMSDRVPRQRP